MILNLNEFLNSTTLPRVCLINAGNECYPLLDFALNQLQHKLGSPVKHIFNADRYFNFSVVRSILNEGNLFNDVTYIEINYKTKPTQDHQQELKSILNQLDSNTTLSITCDKLNKKDHSSQWVKLISDHGSVVNLGYEDTVTVIKYQLQAAGIKITNSALTILQQLNQANISQLLQVVSLLVIVYAPGHEITDNDVKQHSLDNSQYNIYQLSTAYLSANLAQAIKILDNIYQKPEDAILIQWLAADEIKKLIRIKAGLQQKKSFNQIAEELRIWSNVVTLWQGAERRLDYSSLLKLLDHIATLDLIIKGVKKGDIKQQLIQLITQLCSKGH